MGLDMYLTAERHLWARERAVLNLSDEVFNRYLVQSVTLEVGYWRKANAIHNWFVKNVQHGEDDCRPHHVTVADLKSLRDDARSVQDDPTKAPELLPTTSGFFFGCTDYDEGYFHDIAHTLTILETLLQDPDLDKYDLNYQASW